MPEPREYKTEVIVIKKTKLGEADSILTFFTPRLGKIQGFARSLRKPKSKMAGHLELLTHSEVAFSRGRNIDTITGAQTIDAFLPLKSDLWLTSCGLYIAELVNQFSVERQENYPLFQLTLKTLRQLGEAANQDLVLRSFEMRLLESAGYRPQLRECVACHHGLAPVANSFSAAAGGLLCPACSPASQSFSFVLSVNAQKVLRLLQDADFPAVNLVKIDAALARELEDVLGGYIKHILEREVRSAAWLETLRAQRSSSGEPPFPG